MNPRLCPGTPWCHNTSPVAPVDRTAGTAGTARAVPLEVPQVICGNVENAVEPWLTIELWGIWMVSEWYMMFKPSLVRASKLRYEMVRMELQRFVVLNHPLWGLQLDVERVIFQSSPFPPSEQIHEENLRNQVFSEGFFAIFRGRAPSKKVKSDGHLGD